MPEISEDNKLLFALQYKENLPCKIPYNLNDKVRVYKGGSWKDREYWLDPAQRRYFPEDMATDYIGFRCAMSRVGSKSKSKNKTKN
mgnify:CR=1 FL=1